MPKVQVDAERAVSLGGWLQSFLPSREVVVREIHGGVNQGNIFTRVAGLSGGIAVIMGAYGAHAFRPSESNPESDELHRIYDTAYRYHILHSIALLSVPLTKRPVLTGLFMATGMLVFSGTCYYHALTGDTRPRKFTPIGGLLLIASWFTIML